jgi:hypothetical protein
VGALLCLDIGLSTGVALLYGPLIATDTVQANDLAQYLLDVKATLSVQDVPLDTVVAERPLTIWRSTLSRDLNALCVIVETIFATVQWIDPSQWKQQQEPLTAYARSRHLVAWRQARTRHEKDALLVGLWRQGVLDAVKSP